MYESPIKLLMTDIHNQIMAQQEDAAYQAVLHYIPDIDKAELIRALKYDRDQYAKGYADGKCAVRDGLVLCKDCVQWHRHCGVVDSPNGHCFTHDIEMNGYDFCSYGERKGGAEDG